MTRGVLMSAGGDCFLVLLQKYLFDKYWRDEVDRFYICYNADIDKKVVDFLTKSLDDPKITFIYVDHPLGFGLPINRCLNECNEDLVMLLEDDGFIYKKGLLNDLFQMIEGGGVDIIGSPRFSCTNGIAEATRQKYNLDYSGVDDVGPNWWPNFFLCKRSDLLKTDLDFAGKSWKKGETIPGLGLVCQEDECGDTFVWTCIQLRAMGLKIKNVNQYHAMPEEIYEYENKLRNWAREPFGWIHGGSLSSGWNGYLAGNFSDAIPMFEGSKLERETRVAFWKIASDFKEYDEVKEFKDTYKRGIENMIDYYKLDRGRIDKKVTIYKNLLNI